MGQHEELNRLQCTNGSFETSHRALGQKKDAHKMSAMRQTKDQGQSPRMPIPNINQRTTVLIDKQSQCHGGFPCEYCTRTGKLCEPQAPGESNNAFQFVAYQSTRDKPTSLIPPAVDTDRTSLYLNHFIAVITSCQLTSRFPRVATELLPLMDGNEHLWNVAVAIGALNANRRGQVGKSSLHKSPQIVAFSSYQQALSSLQDKLTLSDAPQRDDLLWTTFLLGLFEVSFTASQATCNNSIS